MSESKELMLLPTPQQLGEMSKKELTALAKTTAQGVSNQGVLNELEVYIRARKIADFATELAKGIQGRAEREAQKEQSKGAFEKYGAKVTHTSGASKWNYDNCGDPVYKALLSKLEDLKADLKARENFLQSLPAEGLSVVDEETGEVLYKMRRAVKVSGAEGISITY